MVIVNIGLISERFWLVPACEPSTLLTAFLERFQSACLLAQQLPAMKPEQLKSMVSQDKSDYCRKYLTLWDFDLFTCNSCLLPLAVFDWGRHQCCTTACRGGAKKKGRDSVLWTFGCPGGCVHCFCLWLGRKVRRNSQLCLVYSNWCWWKNRGDTFLNGDKYDPISSNSTSSRCLFHGFICP